ncbi:hypothetical protein B0H63DRAFT_38516 [Podospora didyma]|uniref:Zn(2)-C6 fungal-type domain-containing protein n=1 Tax=Podospora didyma TaxID=330526 RepID=A0AAE0U7R9_9PEZI|nr:hypothetical protein B0H63DRAFT_38516 [Podospora didyma]
MDTTISATAVTKAEPRKRRACDECRGRKLACSKDADGCVRCKREGIRCNYSVQKQMGRPRKRAHVEANKPVEEGPLEEQQATAVFRPLDGNFDFDDSFGMDLDMSFLDVDNSDINFLDLLGGGFPSSEQQDNSLANGAEVPFHSGVNITKSGTNPKINGFEVMGHYLTNIDFDDATNPAPPPPPAQEFTPEEVARFMPYSVTTVPSEASSDDKPPSLSPPTSAYSPTTHATPAPPCACLSRLYLALDSLQRLPTDVAVAMKVARTAARTAHDTILCPVCGQLPLPIEGNLIIHRQPVSVMQNMMMLGALLPSLSNTYMRILEMVDAEVAQADAEGRTMTFSLTDYGGIWGCLAAVNFNCDATEKLEKAFLKPSVWRLTVRALLKVDVYGLNDATHPATISPHDWNLPDSAEAASSIRQLGLKDIISMMEERSRTRHEELDALIASGAVQQPDDTNYVPLCSGDKPTCMRIIDIAKKSMNDLIIP